MPKGCAVCHAPRVKSGISIEWLRSLTDCADNGEITDQAALLHRNRDINNNAKGF